MSPKVSINKAEDLWFANMAVQKVKTVGVVDFKPLQRVNKGFEIMTLLLKHTPQLTVNSGSMLEDINLELKELGHNQQMRRWTLATSFNMILDRNKLLNMKTQKVNEKTSELEDNEAKEIKKGY
jgi:hypothetical protein